MYYTLDTLDIKKYVKYISNNNVKMHRPFEDNKKINNCSNCNH